MRIISGIWKGKTITVPQEGTRPSMDRTRQALFNMLQHVVEGANVLDLYAGSGALALESLSRGATVATCVENDKNAVRVIQQNASSLGCSTLQATQLEVEKFLSTTKQANISLIFADPPYEKNFLDSQLFQALNHEALPDLMKENALFIAESPKKLSESDLKTLPGYWTVLTQRKYGKSFITVFEYNQI